MTFPIINHIDDLLPHIQGNENFSINTKGGYIVIDYILNTPELFKNEWEKECRGIIFDKYDGRVLSRPYHKFFNLNEREESTYKYGIFGEPIVLEKLDGSMIRCFKDGIRWIWGSKAGETFLTPQIEEFVKDKPNYLLMVQTYYDHNYTLIWEWCSRKNRIVVDHPKDRLVLTAMRHNVTGAYYSYRHLVMVANIYGVEVVKEQSFEVAAVKELLLDNFEGIVLRFQSGHMVKVKTDKYVRYHRAKDSITREKNVIAFLVNNQADDFRTLLAPNDRIAFEAFEKDFFHIISHLAHKTEDHLEWMIGAGFTKKQFALEYQNMIKPLLRRIYFKYLESDAVVDGNIYQDLINILRGKVGNQASVDEARQLFQVNWADYIGRTVCVEIDNG